MESMFSEIDGSLRGKKRVKLKSIIEEKDFYNEEVAMDYVSGDWGFSMFRLRHLEAPMVTVVMDIFRSRNLIKVLGLDEGVCERYFLAIEKKYAVYPTLMYHTSLHAADVVHSLHNLMDTECVKVHLSPLQVFAALVAAAVHDVGHPGFTNQFLCATGNALAILYNDKSVLENHHAATAFMVAQDPACDIFAALSVADRLAVRRQMISMIMSTDMAEHNNLLAKCRGLSLANMGAGGTGVLFDFLLHLADLGACTKPWALCQEWATCVMEELFAQGDKEVALGLPVSMYHRAKTTVPRSQMDFVDYVIRPLWLEWDKLIGVPQSMQTLAMEENRRQWSLI